MSEALIALISAAVTTIGLAIINKLLSRPGEPWKQASEMREELRKDLVRTTAELDAMRESHLARDREILDVKEKMMTLSVELRSLTIQLQHCRENHQDVQAELATMRDRLHQVQIQQRLPLGE